MARLAAIFDLMFMVLSPLWDLWRTGMVLMAIGRTRTGKVQHQGGAPCGLCEKSQGFTRLWVNASQNAEGPGCPALRNRRCDEELLRRHFRLRTALPRGRGRGRLHRKDRLIGIDQACAVFRVLAGRAEILRGLLQDLAH